MTGDCLKNSNRMQHKIFGFLIIVIVAGGIQKASAAAERCQDIFDKAHRPLPVTENQILSQTINDSGNYLVRRGCD